MLKHLCTLGFVTLLTSCGSPDGPAAPSSSIQPSLDHGGTGAVASGGYHFTIPADFNGGIFGIEIGNHVSFTVRRTADGGTDGRFRYVQSAEGTDFIFSGRITCFERYDTPVLVGFPDIPAMVANRIKWGGVVQASSDATVPVGRFIWFQSIDNSGEPGSAYADLSTLPGFGTQAANEAFCDSPNVPNPNFGPHPVTAGQIIVR